MTDSPNPNPVSKAPQQTRSRQTELRLMEATMALLKEGGLEACQIPEVARRAGVSVGAVYRRFDDKNALLAATFRHTFSCQVEGREVLRAHLADQPSLEAIFHSLVSAFVASLVASGKFTAALQRFARHEADASFQALVKETRRQSIALMEDVIRTKAPASVSNDQIRFALVAVTATLNALMLNDEAEALGWSATDPRIVDEMTRLAMRYLVTPAA
ncbi:MULTISPECIES: TetR/AcrR family transcriptional regulator [unclassified Sphingomonas]|uniref:TetR/AcrR family transcriptional regulator n=1 Tax=unclassified Sphingomonas TaxID=196159 RepID=UPI000BDBF299|nr:MAG: hypothetical protein B7Z43_08890 [Sphingomonas sp. 12-62-6]OYX40753.1 MAG: hypothetical protein B7Y98_00220 [Sphingomonas sp. 32-62-10]